MHLLIQKGSSRVLHIEMGRGLGGDGSGVLINFSKSHGFCCCFCLISYCFFIKNDVLMSTTIKSAHAYNDHITIAARLQCRRCFLTTRTHGWRCCMIMVHL